jgi:hypothetical protein
MTTTNIEGVSEMPDLFDLWFGGVERPRWREEYEMKMYQLEKRTGLNKEQLKKVADAIQELEIIKL